MSSHPKFQDAAQAFAATSAVANREKSAAAPKIWIDLDNSPHVPFFAPIIEALEKGGYPVLITARDCFQVRDLADLFHLNYKLIGRHPGKGAVRKIGGLCLRALQLIPTILQEKPAVAVSHCSRSQLIGSAACRIPSLFLGDYEFATGWAFIRPTWHMCPDVIPDSALHFYRGQTLKYPGIKEDVYVSRFTPTPGIRSRLNLEDDDLVVTLRPPATEAHYHTSRSDELFEAAVEFLSHQPRIKLVMLPRNEKQGISLRRRWPDLFQTGKIRIPEKVVDGLDLIWHSDLVISGGGTMNREAAALGVPVYSVFRGKIGAVDQYLSKMGRLVLLESSDEFPAKISLARRDRSAKPRNGNSAALSFIVKQIVAAAESRQVASSPTKHVPIPR